MKNLLLIIAFIVSANSHATLIELSFDQAEYSMNDTITGQLIASDLSYSLGGFAGTIDFDSNELSLTDWAFGNGFDDGFGSWFFGDDSIAGSLYLEDFADFSADEATLIANQGTGFVLASFSFKALTAGIHTVSYLQGFEIVSLDNTQLDSFSGRSATFNVSEVPEPMSMVLFASALGLVFRKQFRK